MAKDCLLQVNGNRSGQACYIYLNPAWNDRNQGWFVSGSSGGFRPVQAATQGTIQQLPTQIAMFAGGKAIGVILSIDIDTIKTGDTGFFQADVMPGFQYQVVGLGLEAPSDTPHSLIARIQMSYKGQH